MRTHLPSDRGADAPPSAVSPVRPGGLAICTVSTISHLHLVRNLVRSIRESWQPAARVLTALADGGDDRVNAAARVQLAEVGIDVVEPADLAIANFGWLAAKYDATELCCAVKPYLVRWALDQGAAQVVYTDSDLHYFAAPTALIELGERHDFAVVPHTVEPFPGDDAWLRPTLGDLSGAGLLNAGLFSARAGHRAREFLHVWARLVTAPGAFLTDLGAQHEQHFFNWVIAFAEDVAICRDRTINVAYWNLHERPLRWCGLDGGPDDRWMVGDQPLGSFHFSGFSPGDGWLSRHDARHSLSLDVNLEALCRFYSARLEEVGARSPSRVTYAWAEIEGHDLTSEVRDALKRAERFTTPTIASWQADAPSLPHLLHRVLGPRHVLPQYLDQVAAARPDLRALNADDTVFPERLLAWTSRWFDREYSHGWLFEQYCDFAWERATVDRIAAELASRAPGVSHEMAQRLLVRDRARALEILGDEAGAHTMAEVVRDARYRFPAFDPALCLRLIYTSRNDLRRAFPDPLGDDLAGFRAWAAASLRDEYDVPEAMLAFTATLEPRRSLARLVAFLRSDANLHARFAEGGLTTTLLRDLVPVSVSGAGFSATDLVLVDWWMRGRDVLYVESPAPGAGSPSPSHDTRTALLDQVVVRDLADPRFARFLSAWLRGRGAETDAAAEVTDHLAAETAAVLAALGDSEGTAETNLAGALDALSDPTLRRRVAELVTPDPRGVNVFGYFQSPIGLGRATHGLCRSLGLAGYRHHEIVLSNSTMSAEFDLHHLVPDFGFECPRNLVVSYPHIQGDVFDVFPACFFAGRETIGYLAWEQRDLHPDWARRMSRFDRLFALSGFAARSIEQGVGRPVGVLPCVVDVDATRAAEYTRESFGIPGDAFVVGFVFDASSSVERKNPLGAVRALGRAFGGRRDVVVVMKISNGDRIPVRRSVDEIVAELHSAGLPHLILQTVLPRAAVEGLIATFDLYLSLHRAEGFGYTLAEAMLLGVPAVATRYSGNLDFMNDENSWLVRCRETIVRRADGPFRPGTVWADPDLDDAADQCRQVYADGAAARRRAEIARRDVQALLSPEAVARRLSEVLDGVPAAVKR